MCRSIKSLSLTEVIVNCHLIWIQQNPKSSAANCLSVVVWIALCILTKLQLDLSFSWVFQVLPKTKTFLRSFGPKPPKLKNYEFSTLKTRLFIPFLPFKTFFFYLFDKGHKKLKFVEKIWSNTCVVERVVCSKTWLCTFYDLLSFTTICKNFLILLNYTVYSI